MLKGIDPLLNADVLHALRSMGHTDKILLVDANYPALTSAQASKYGKLLTIGADTPRAIQAILSVFPLDSFVDSPAKRMQPDDEKDGANISTFHKVQQEAQRAVNNAAGQDTPFQPMRRPEFYARANEAFCVIQTLDLRAWGCFIFEKGVFLAPNEAAETKGSNAVTWAKAA